MLLISNFVLFSNYALGDFVEGSKLSEAHDNIVSSHIAS